MKLLGWMHRKFRQNSNEPLKDFVMENVGTHMSGQPPHHQQYCYAKPIYGTKFYEQNPAYFRKSFTGIETTQVEEEDHEDEESPAISEIFDGFLAIGTLGSDPNISAPSTPTFTISLENEVTEKELKLLNDNLEKILGAEVKEDICDASSARNSHVSAGRSSQGSTITLSGKTLEIPEANHNGSNVCPLQGYLFGSAIEMSETTTVKKEHRTSLRELFQKTKITDEYGGGRCERDEKRTEKDADKSAVNMMKRMLKKRVPHLSRSSTAAYGRPANSSPAETKLNKILHIFHRKVHPESSTSSKTHMKLPKEKKKHRSISSDGASNYQCRTFPKGETMALSQGVIPHKGTRNCYKSQFNPQFALKSDSNGNREFWIKSDADYLVLEL
ncbi:PREDICTED: protein LAZY 1-like [Tarenaya hassleriana]|uniref:protein LAZY 1-like n=1 Tax=Tarenaya hassleriana TaxID=28532 RepID=UPI00053C80F7|nr:PREDICTED: protein LAZY 1-like [Tarenaya hassleriana]